MTGKATALIVAIGLAAVHGAVAAQDARPFCADRPGLGTPACTLEPGRVMLEAGALDWTREQDPEIRTDTLLAGDVLLRVGAGRATEVQLGWTAFGRVRTRDRETGSVNHASGTGDVALAVRHNLSNPDGAGFSAAVMLQTTLPTGGDAIGAGDWSAGVAAPLGWELSDMLSLGATPQIEAAVDADGNGRHLAFGGAIGLGMALGEQLGAAVELQATRDDDPAGRSTEALASLSFAWQPLDDLQFDAGGVAGLNADSPDLQLYVGVARRF